MMVSTALLPSFLKFGALFMDGTVLQCDVCMLKELAKVTVKTPLERLPYFNWK